MTTCPECSKPFSDQNALDTHRQLAHPTPTIGPDPAELAVEAVRVKIRRNTDKLTAAALMVHHGSVKNLETWSGPPERTPSGAGPTTDPTTGALILNDNDGNPLDYRDSTGDAAGVRPDIHEHALREIHRILDTDDHDLDELLNHLKLGLATREADERRAKLPAPCTSCQRINDHQGRKLYTPARVTRTVGKKRHQLCDWCDNFHSDWHQLPPEQVLRAYHDGRRPNRRTIERAIRDQRAAAGSRT